MATCREEVYDVFIVGGGWSGLLSCKYAKENNLSVKVVDKRDDLGGVWKYSSDPNITTVMKKTRTSSSSTLTEISDYPMPPKYGDFPKHTEIYEYLNDFANSFDLKKHIHFNCSVINIIKLGMVWQIETDSGGVTYSKNVIICSGAHQKPNTTLQDTLLSSFTGTVIHSGVVKEFDECFRNKKVMIIGGGETASDILEEWYPHCESIIWSIPNGQHFFRKYGKLLPHRKPQALDKASSRALKFISPQTKSKPGLAWVCRWTTGGSLVAYQGHGIAEFKNRAPFFHSFVNKHAHVLDYIDYKKVIPKSKISSVQGRRVQFQDGTSHSVDVIILCTGYITDFPFLSDIYKCPIKELYKYTFHPLDSSLSFVGYVRPVIGSIPMISEMQARFICRVIGGNVTLACKRDMMKTIENDNIFWGNYFKNTSSRLGALVEGYTYMDDVAKLCNCYPDYWKLLLRNPRGFRTAILAPASPCMYTINEPQKEKSALKNLERHSSDTITSLNLLTIIFLRLIMFDWFCDILGEIKFTIQTSPLWIAIRDHPIIRFLDYVWCTPKRLLFDNVSRA